MVWAGVSERGSPDLHRYGEPMKHRLQQLLSFHDSDLTSHLRSATCRSSLFYSFLIKNDVKAVVFTKFKIYFTRLKSAVFADFHFRQQTDSPCEQALVEWRNIPITMVNNTIESMGRCQPCVDAILEVDKQPTELLLVSCGI